MGLTIDYFYSLTPRQFFNIQKGWSDLREAESNERLILTRKIMYASLRPWAKDLKEADIWKFDFEKTANENRLDIDEETLNKELEQTRNFWQVIDSKREKAT